MRATPLRKVATYEDILALPEHLVGEILGGDLFALPRPSPRHALAASGLGGALFDVFARPGGGDPPGGWWILDEPELHLHDDVLVPDLAGWRRERMPALPEKAFFELAPDWACEVPSPATEAIDRGRKMEIYAREGVNHLWLVNPVHRTLETYRLAASRWTLLTTFVGDGAVRAEPFEVVNLDMSRWWAPEAEPGEGAPSAQSG
jgi:Uma2 family endonuclease